MFQCNTVFQETEQYIENCRKTFGSYDLALKGIPFNSTELKKPEKQTVHQVNGTKSVNEKVYSTVTIETAEPTNDKANEQSNVKKKILRPPKLLAPTVHVNQQPLSPAKASQPTVADVTAAEKQAQKVIDVSSEIQMESVDILSTPSTLNMKPKVSTVVKTILFSEQATTVFIIE